MNKATNDSQPSATIVDFTWKTELFKFIGLAGWGFGAVTAMLLFKRVPSFWSGIGFGLAFGFSQSYADAHSLFK